MRYAFALLVLMAGIASAPHHARAQWQFNGAPVCTATRFQRSPIIVSDGSRGAIIAWRDDRTGSGYHIYAQRMNAEGTPLWESDGVAICTAKDEKYPSGIISDGAGGAIITWPDYRNGYPDSDVYVQLVNAAGVPQWAADGFALCTATNAQDGPTMVSDGAGGAIVSWSDYRNGAGDIYAQRVNASGIPQWAADGLALCTADGEQEEATIVSDDGGGAVVAWYDSRSGVADIYAQRVNAAGVPQWTADGVPLCTAANIQYLTGIVSDGAGGAIVTWYDYRSGTNYDVYVQRVNAAGVSQWTANGVALCTAAEDQNIPRIASDGAGGAIVSWSDYRDHPGNWADIYARRVNAAGVPQWTADGVALCMAQYEKPSHGIASDGTGGAIVTWADHRNDFDTTDIYAQRVNAAGAPLWTVDGVALCTAAESQNSPRLVSDDAGGAIVTWTDDRNSFFTSSDIYAQHVADPSNAVAIASFDASEANGVVTLRSAFRSDLGVEAVNVYRAAGIDDNQLMVIERVDDVRSDRFEYVDRDVAPGQSYRYRIGVIDSDGEFFSPVVTVSVKSIAVSLAQNQPNPFNPTTTIRFVLPVREDVTLAIYDASGHLVRTLVNDVQAYGEHEVTWDGRDNNGAVMGSGVYFYRLRAGKITESKKMVLLK